MLENWDFDRRFRALVGQVRMRAAGRVALLAMSGLLGGGACSGDTAGPPAMQSTQGIGQLVLNQHAIIMAAAPPFDTVQLHATPLTTQGTVTASTAQTRYYVAQQDTSIVVDSITGVVTAKVPSYQTVNGSFVPNANIIATLTDHGITFADTASCIVTPTAPAAALSTFSIDSQWPVAPLDSLTAGAQGYARVYSTAHDVNGQTIILPVWYISVSDPTVINTDHHWGTGVIDWVTVYGFVGNTSATLYGQVWYYGVARRDSLTVHVGYSHTATLTSYQRTPLNSLNPQSFWWPEVVNLSAPAAVQFINNSYQLENSVIFDDSADILIDSAAINNVFQLFGFNFPVSQPGNIAPFLQDTTGSGAVCAIAQFDGTTNSEDSLCIWTGFGVGAAWDNQKYRLIRKPGTYNYHNLFGVAGQIIVH